MGTDQDNNTQRWEMEERLHHVDRQFFLASALICDAEKTYDHDWANRINDAASHLTHSLGSYMEENPIDLAVLYAQSRV